MRIPVIVVVPGQEPLRESFEAHVQKRAASIPMTEAKVPGLVVDTSMPAVPIGTGRMEQAKTASFSARQSQAFAVRAFVETRSSADIPEKVNDQPVFADPRIAPLPTCGGTPPVGAKADVASKLNVSGLATKHLDGSGVAVAIMDTGINLAHLIAKLGSAPQLDAGNSWTPPGTTTSPGGHPVDHGSMCAFDALIAAPKATLLDFPILAASAPGGSVMGGSLSTALLAYAQLLANWAVAFAPGGTPKYKGLVVSNSWGVFHPSWDFPPGHPGRYIDNPRHPFNQIVSALASTNADILFAAGNCGAPCPDMRCKGKTAQTICGANAHSDVLTLAGCDTSDLRVGYSSQGPSIAGMFAQKPDVTSYTHFLGSEAFGSGSPDSGTSAACPVAAGCLAALRTRASTLTTPPAHLFAQLRMTARGAGGPAGTWNADYGFGIMDPIAAASSLGL